MVAMTRARPASYGLGNPPPLDRWIDAVLMLVVCLVQGVRATFGMRRRSSIGDWHTEAEAPALPQTKPDIQLEATQPNHAVILGLVPRIPVGPTRGQADTPHETINRDSRDKPENDTVDVDRLVTSLSIGLPRDLSSEAQRAQGEGGDPVSARSALPTRTISPRSFRRTSESRVDRAPCSDLQLQVCIRRHTVPAFRPSPE